MRDVIPRLLLVAIALLAVPSSAYAQADADRATARALFFQAQEALDRNDFATAADLFGRSDAILHAPTASLGFARAQVGLRHLVGAYETYNRIVREGVTASASAAFVQALADAKRELIALEARLPSVTLKVSGGPNPEVTVDGAPLPKAALGVKRFVDPGKHVVRASTKGYLPAETTFTVDEGGSASAQLILQRDPKYPPIGGAEEPSSGPAPAPAAAPSGEARAQDASGSSTKRTVGFVVGGLGIAGFAVAAVSGAMFLGKKSTAEEHCNANRQCDADGIDAFNAAKTLGVVNTIALAGGIVGVGVGTYLVVSSKKRNPPAATIETMLTAQGPRVSVGRSF